MIDLSVTGERLIEDVARMVGWQYLMTETNVALQKTYYDILFDAIICQKKNEPGLLQSSTG